MTHRGEWFHEHAKNASDKAAYEALQYWPSTSKFIDYASVHLQASQQGLRSIYKKMQKQHQ